MLTCTVLKVFMLVLNEMILQNRSVGAAAYSSPGACFNLKTVFPGVDIPVIMKRWL